MYTAKFYNQNLQLLNSVSGIHGFTEDQDKEKNKDSQDH